MRVRDAVSIMIVTAVIVLLGMFKVIGFRLVPKCQEDAVLVGYVSFEAGRWKHYECGPALDDFTP